ncbi:glycosyltransferase family 4 protein [Azospira sp. APE16]|uniref:glycosyltransferase family 4 protein n=1 Tax=Azospira sp. APE16 TaxID=3394231 RepID=UPI003A4E285C
MKIVHTEASCGWGGQEIRILSEAAGMIERGHEVVLLCPPESRIYQEAPGRGVPVVALPIGRKRLPGFFAMRRWLAANPVDVINTHSSTDSWLAALACATLAKAPPLVRTRHVSVPIPNNRSTRWLYLKASAHIAVTGELLKRRMIADNGMPPDHLTSVPTGIDTRHFSPAMPAEKAALRPQLGLPEGACVFGIVATLRSWKGHSYLIDAFARIDDPRARLLIVGGGPQQQALEQQIARLGLGDRVIMAGEQRDVQPWLRAMDVFILPSYANEGVPQALMQAMSCGLACITTDVGSISELASDGETALMVPTKDVAALQARMEELAADSGRRQLLGAAARRRCLEGYDRETMLDRMETIFRHAIAQQQPR